jgi:hypothetical protein
MWFAWALIALGTRDALGVPLSAASPVQVVSWRIETDRVPRAGTGKITAVVSFSVADMRVADPIRFTIVMPDGVNRTFTARGLFSPGILIRNIHLAQDFVPSSALTRPGAQQALDSARVQLRVTEANRARLLKNASDHRSRHHRLLKCGVRLRIHV